MAFVLALGAATADPAAADEAVHSEPGKPGGAGAADPVAGIRPEALVTTGAVLALVMGATAAGTAARARRRARE